MNKIALLNTLIVMNKSGEINTGENQNDADKMLQDIKMAIIENIRNEIFRDITDIHTGYYAPDFENWKQFLNYCNGNADYEAVLNDFEEEELEKLWQASHITEPMADEDINKELILQIRQMKMFDVVGRYAKAAAPQKAQLAAESVRAKIRGLYGMIYE